MTANIKILFVLYVYIILQIHNLATDDANTIGYGSIFENLIQNYWTQPNSTHHRNAPW